MAQAGGLAHCIARLSSPARPARRDLWRMTPSIRGSFSMSKHHSAYEGRSVLITGGLGFIGSNLAHRFVEAGNVDVTVVDALYPGQGGNLYNIEGIRDRINVIIADIGNDSVINHAVCGVDYIFNLAGSTSHL